MTVFYFILAAPIAGGICGAVWAFVNIWREARSRENDSEDLDLTAEFGDIVEATE